MKPLHIFRAWLRRSFTSPWELFTEAQDTDKADAERLCRGMSDDLYAAGLRKGDFFADKASKVVIYGLRAPYPVRAEGRGA